MKINKFNAPNFESLSKLRICRQSYSREVLWTVQKSRTYYCLVGKDHNVTEKQTWARGHIIWTLVLYETLKTVNLETLYQRRHNVFNCIRNAIVQEHFPSPSTSYNLNNTNVLSGILAIASCYRNNLHIRQHTILQSIRLLCPLCVKIYLYPTSSRAIILTRNNELLLCR